MLNQHTVELLRPLHEATPLELDDYCRFLHNSGWERYEGEVQECVERAFKEWQRQGPTNMAQWISAKSPLPASTHQYTYGHYPHVKTSRVTVRLPNPDIPGTMARAVIERQVREQLDSLPENQ